MTPLNYRVFFNFIFIIFYGISPYGISPSTNALVSSKVALTPKSITRLLRVPAVPPVLVVPWNQVPLSSAVPGMKYIQLFPPEYYI